MSFPYIFGKLNQGKTAEKNAAWEADYSLGDFKSFIPDFMDYKNWKVFKEIEGFWAGF